MLRLGKADHLRRWQLMIESLIGSRIKKLRKSEAQFFYTLMAEPKTVETPLGRTPLGFGAAAPKFLKNWLTIAHKPYDPDHEI